ncbi:hypothetical protein ACIA8E_41745 [Streptomyces sp. NPDC051664]|uniref:hypothetical protein n=1 Tax=Streptomyces sp. NPDC051664 TaxID=3365668 RepID=UPI0037A88DB6
MSISRRVTFKRLLGVGAVAVALSAASATSAWAVGAPGGKGWDNGGHHSYKPGQGGGTKSSGDRCEFSLDGANWYKSVKVGNITLKPGGDGKVHVNVRASDGSSSCTVSLASYRTHGANFATSGKQVLHDWDTVTVTTGTDTLNVAVPDITCFAQVDLYHGNKKYDGVFDANDGYEHGNLPEGPDHSVIGDKKIAWWNGGTKDCTTQTGPSAPATPSTPTDETTTPPAPEVPSSAPASPSVSVSESTTPPHSVAVESPSGGPGHLAETGASNIGLISGAAGLLVAGGGVALATYRRQAARRH